MHYSKLKTAMFFFSFKYIVTTFNCSVVECDETLKMPHLPWFGTFFMVCYREIKLLGHTCSAHNANAVSSVQ